MTIITGIPPQVETACMLEKIAYTLEQIAHQNPILELRKILVKGKPT